MHHAIHLTGVGMKSVGSMRLWLGFLTRLGMYRLGLRPGSSQMQTRYGSASAGRLGSGFNGKLHTLHGSASAMASMADSARLPARLSRLGSDQHGSVSSALLVPRGFAPLARHGTVSSARSTPSPLNNKSIYAPPEPNNQHGIGLQGSMFPIAPQRASVCPGPQRT